MDSPRIFLTDYASYNEGTQFEFGHWLDLDQFDDEIELMEYIENHFEKCDKERPLDEYGTKREEYMYTDYENFPDELYSECGMDFKSIYKWMELEEYQKVAFEFLLNDGQDIDYSLSHIDNVRIIKRYNNDKYDLFAEYYPEADEADNNCDFLQINYERFLDVHFHEFTSLEGIDYLIEYNH